MKVKFSGLFACYACSQNNAFEVNRHKKTTQQGLFCVHCKNLNMIEVFGTDTEEYMREENTSEHPLTDDWIDRPLEQKKATKKQEQIGAGIGLLLCATAIFIFVWRQPLPDWLAGVLNGIGLCVTMAGILVSCNEFIPLIVAKRSQKGDRQ